MQLENLLPLALTFLHSITAVHAEVYKAQLHKLPNSDIFSFAKDPSATQDNHDAPLYYNFYYYMNVSLGTPPQELRVILDTKSADLWVPALGCVGECESSLKYNHDVSSTYKANGTVSELKDWQYSMKGFVSQDTLILGDLTISKQDFGEAEKVAGQIFHHNYDGLLGLGIDKKSNIKSIPPLYNALRQGLINKAEFGLYLGRDANNPDVAGEVTFGGYDDSKIRGEISWVTSNNTEWRVDITKLTIGDENLGVKPAATAAFDTLTPYIYIPGETFFRFFTIIGASMDDKGSILVDCDSRDRLPDLTFYLSDKPFTIGPDVYTTKSGDKCVSLVLPKMDNGPNGSSEAVLGYRFLQAFYSIYDFGENAIGLAKAI